ncbi:zinc finger FYVE domain-containing protein 1 isoform X2 [Agrilus planipennis]|nr:zinc finger FYVE domain-containing protein 1 isoform X2 [Agrilus planipennis]XP_018333747.1 zinc finger FYVE domain-containing protein 1 isoform X2 [Agrilus planipennis]
MDNTLAKTALQQHIQKQNPCIMEPLDSLIMDNASGDSLLLKKTIASMKTENENRLESLNISIEDELNDSLSFKLLDENEQLKVANSEQFIKKLRIPATFKKVKVVSIFGNTGEGKSHTLNETFFNSERIFRVSPEQSSCTLGVWAAFDPELSIICLDTEGLLGVSKKEDQRTRLLLKVLAVSDVVIYRTRAERLQRDMYTFLGGASKAFKDHFQKALQSVWKKADVESPPHSLGPSVIIFHETRHTNTLQCIPSVSESPEDILRSRFADLNLPIDAFSSLKYIGVQTKEGPTSFKEIKNAVQMELENTTVRSARPPKIIYHTLKGLNQKFRSQLPNNTPQLHLDQYFTCPEICQSCSTRCTLSMGHKEEREGHYSPSGCRFQHQFQNCVYLCKRCYQNGMRVTVKPSYQSITENSWTSFLTYVWSGYIIECRNCGEIYRSRQHWFGNKDPQEGAVIAEIIHMWPGERNFILSPNSAQRILDGISVLSEVVKSVGSQPTKAVSSWMANQVAPSYWRPNEEITHCHKCKTPFQQNAAKHHCRSCGEGFCEGCSSKLQPVPSRGWYTDVRVCDDCYQETPPSLSHCVDESEIRARKYGEAVVNSITAVASVLDIPKGIIKDTARPSYWMPDNECDKCCCCENPFGPIFPLHHCRECGKGVCDDCSNTRKPVPYRGWNTPVRVCDNCIKQK